MQRSAKNRQQTDSHGAELLSPAQLDSVFVMGWMALGLWLSYCMLAPFISVLTWALTLAVIMHPVQIWLDSRSRYHSLNVLLTTLLGGCVVVLPVVWGIQQLSIQLYAGAQQFPHWMQGTPWQQSWQQALPWLRRAGWILPDSMDVSAILNSLSGWLLAGSAGWVTSSALALLQSVLVFYVLFFLLRDRHRITVALYALSPLPAIDMHGLLRHLAATIQAVVYGTLGIAAIQGLLGGLMFWWLGLPRPLLWGGIMALVSVMPMLGPFIVWVPAAAYLLLAGQWQDALTLVLWGMLVVGTIDNWLRPYWVSRQLHLHPLQIFFSIVGGLLLFGAAGLMLGPLIFSTTRYLLSHWKADVTPASLLQKRPVPDRVVSERPVSDRHAPDQ